MAQTLKLKRSAVSGNAPSTGDLALGEIAINTYDGKIFIKKDDGTESIVTFEAGGGSSNAGTIEEDSFSGNGSTTAFTLTTAPSSEENLLVFIDATFQNRDSFTISGTTITFDTAPDNGSSVRVYHVIPGTIDDGILTVAKFAADTLVLESEGISSNDNDTTIPTSAAVKDYVDTQVATVDTLPEVLANGNTTGGTDISVSSGDDITFADSSKAIFGAGSDLQIYHDGSHSFITDSGTGNLRLQGTNLALQNAAGTKNYFLGSDGGAATLYHNNTSVLSTTADGILVTSEVEADEFIGDLRGAVLFKAQAGENVTKGDVVYISGISGNTTVVSKADADDASKMPAFGIVAATTTSGQPVDIYTQGILGSLDTSSYSEGDELFVSTTAGALTDTPPTGETAAIQKIAKVTRSNELSGSIFITGAGRSNAVPNLDEDQFFLGNASNQAVATDFSDAVEALSINNVVEDTTPQLGGDLASNGNDILFADNDKAVFGAGSDLQIYHDGTNSYIQDAGTGSLILEGTTSTQIKGSAFVILRSTAGENMAIGNANGSFDLYYDAVKKLATTSTGIDVTGTISSGAINATGDITITSTYPKIAFVDTDNNPDISIIGGSGQIAFYDETNSGYVYQYISNQHNFAAKNLTNIGTISSGAITSTGEVEATALDINGNGDISGNLTLGGYLAGPATFTIDPAAVGDNTGTVVIAGNLQVDGTTTTINSTTLTVDDLNITLASGAANAAAANGAGLTVDCGSDTDATFTYDGTNDEWDFNKDINVTGTVVADGLTVDGEITGPASNNLTIRSKYSATIDIDSDNNQTDRNFQVIHDGSKLILKAEESGDISFYDDTGTTPALFWDASAESLGIGTTSPAYKLNVAGDIVADGDGNTRTIGFDFYGALKYNLYMDGSSDADKMFIRRGTTNVATFDSSGNVGIGTTTPARPLDIVSTDQIGIQYTNSTATSTARLYLTAGTSSGILQQYGNTHSTNANEFRIVASAGDITLAPSSTERVRVTTSGNVGIGNTSPNAKLQVEEYGIDTTETSTTATTQVAIHTMSATTFRSARFTVQVTNSTDSTYHLTEILMIHDGTTPSITEYGTIFTGSAEATFDADISSGNVRLLATPASTDTMEFKVVAHSITT